MTHSFIHKPRWSPLSLSLIPMTFHMNLTSSPSFSLNMSLTAAGALMRPCLAGSPGGPAVPAAAGLGPQLPREQRQQAVGFCCAGEEDTGWTGLVWSGWTGHRGRGGPTGEVLWPIPSARERAASQREPQSLPGGWRNAALPSAPDRQAFPCKPSRLRV